MTDTTIVTPLHALKDPTGPIRSRRARAKRKTAVRIASIEAVSASTENHNEIKPDDTVLVGRAIAGSRIPWSVWPLAGTTVGLMAVSLTHLSEGVEQLTAIPAWQSWAMAAGIDCMLISVALAMLTATVEVKRDIAKVAHCLEGGTLVMSARLNALAFTGGAFDAAHWAQIAFGCFVPAAISAATFILARLTKR